MVDISEVVDDSQIPMKRLYLVPEGLGLGIHTYQHTTFFDPKDWQGDLQDVPEEQVKIGTGKKMFGDVVPVPIYIHGV